MPEIPVAGCRKIGVDLFDTVLITESGAPGFTTAEWATDAALTTALVARLAQTGEKTVEGYTGNAAIRKWEVFDATKPGVEPEFVTAFGGLQFAKKTNKSIEFVDYDNSITNHQWHIEMNCLKIIKFLPLAGSFLYGPKEFVVGSFSSWHGIVNNTDTPTEGWTGRITWGSVLELPKRVRPAIL
ncbi:MAG: hypothetical protein NT073_28105 [Spirosoma sp.]|nr:hypothetical protein [Spirosoma sp.]